jgi:hypothetical protein
MPASAYEKAAAVCLDDGFSDSHGDHQKVISKMHLTPVTERETEATRQNSPA